MTDMLRMLKGQGQRVAHRARAADALGRLVHEATDFICTVARQSEAKAEWREKCDGPMVKLREGEMSIG